MKKVVYMSSVLAALIFSGCSLKSHAVNDINVDTSTSVQGSFNGQAKSIGNMVQDGIDNSSKMQN
jgi:hypothetical protein